MATNTIKNHLIDANLNIDINRREFVDNLRKIRSIKRRRASWLEVTTGKKDKESRYARLQQRRAEPRVENMGMCDMECMICEEEGIEDACNICEDCYGYGLPPAPAPSPAPAPAPASGGGGSIDVNKTRIGTMWCTNTTAHHPKTCDDFVQKSGLGPEIAQHIEGGSGTWRDRSDPANGPNGTRYGYREGAICIPWPEADSSSDNGNCQPGDKIIARSKENRFTAAEKADFKKYADIRSGTRAATQKKADDLIAHNRAIQAMKDNADINKTRTGTAYCANLFLNKDYAKCDDYVQYSGFTEQVRALNFKGYHTPTPTPGYDQGHICEPWDSDANDSDAGDCKPAPNKVIASSKRREAPANIKTQFENTARAQASAKGLVWDESAGGYIDRPTASEQYDPASVDVNKARSEVSWCTNLYIAYDKCDDYVQYSGMTEAQASRMDAGSGTYKTPGGSQKGYEQGAICRPWDSGDSSEDGNCKPSGKVIAHSKSKRASQSWITNAGGDERPPPSSVAADVVAQTLIEFERNVIARTNAENSGIGCTVPSTPARTCTDGLTGQPRFRACIEQGNMWEDLNTNPILRHFVNAYYETCDDPPCGEPIMTTALKAKVYGSPTDLNARLDAARAADETVPKFGIGWLKIPTTSTNNLFANWGTNEDSANHSYTTPLSQANGDYTIYGDEHLNMLIARKFTRSESKKIFDGLANQPMENSARGSQSISMDIILFLLKRVIYLLYHPTEVLRLHI